MAQGEVLGFEEYVRTRQEALLRSARRLVPDPVDAQDLLQTALARTFGRWDGIADKSLADAYLRRVMINTRTEWWRARRLEEVPTEELPDARVEDGTEQRADRALLMDVLGVLAPKQRSVVVLRHWEQMSTEETAAALGMSAGTVKSTLHRALARLRQELENRERDGRTVREDRPDRSGPAVRDGRAAEGSRVAEEGPAVRGVPARGPRVRRAVCGDSVRGDAVRAEAVREEVGRERCAA
ncbi:SigE family RNA polymerase sigma factor [Streptomyces sp. NPDC004749]